MRRTLDEKDVERAALSASMLKETLMNNTIREGGVRLTLHPQWGFQASCPSLPSFHVCATGR